MRRPAWLHNLLTSYPTADLDEALNRNQRCPTCGSALFQEGPHGGMSINIRCVKCGSTYWMGPPSIGFTPGRTEQAADLFKGEPRTIGKIFGEDR